MSLDRLKEIYRTLKPKKDAGPRPVGWKRGTVETLRNFYIEKVLVYYLREQDNHWQGWSKSRFILEIEMYEADIMEELALTGTSAAMTKGEASDQDVRRPLAPTCPDCGVEMLQRTNRVTANKFWGCHLFPNCKRIFPLLIDGKPTAVVMAGMEKQQRQKEDGAATPEMVKRAGYNKSPEASVGDSLGSWENVSDRVATSTEDKGDQKFNVNLDLTAAE